MSMPKTCTHQTATTETDQMRMKKRKRQQQPDDNELLRQQLAFALEQTASGKSALRRATDMDPKLRQRLTTAVAYWDAEATRLADVIDHPPLT